MIKRIYIGAICNRDVEVFDQIKKFSKVHYNNKISIVSLLKKDNSFSTKHFKKKIKKYPISFLIVKLYSEPSNQIIYNAIRTYLPNIPFPKSPGCLKGTWVHTLYRNIEGRACPQVHSQTGSIRLNR